MYMNAQTEWLNHLKVCSTLNTLDRVVYASRFIVLASSSDCLRTSSLKYLEWDVEP